MCDGVMNEIQGPLVEHCKNTLNSFYGDDPQASDSYGRMVNSHHFKYVMHLDSHLYLHVFFYFVLFCMFYMNYVCQ